MSLKISVEQFVLSVVQKWNFFLARPVSGSDWLRQADENCVQIDDFDREMVIILLFKILHILSPSPKFTKCVSLDILWMIVESGKRKGFVW